MLDIKSKEYKTMIDEMNQGKEVVITPWGRSKINQGYYSITNRKKGFHGKLVHILIWEAHYRRKKPKGYDLHHMDNNTLNNAVNNIQCCESKKHVTFHKGNEIYRQKLSESMKGKKPWNTGKNLSDEHKQKIGKANKGKFSGEKNPAAKYNYLWNIKCVHYNKGVMFRKNRIPNPVKCFGFKYNGKDVNIGGFHDFVSCEIINDLIDEFTEVF